MLKSGLWSRVLGSNPCLTTQRPAGQFARLARGLLTKKDEDGADQLEVVEDDLESPQSRTKVKPMEYQFYGKNTAVVLETRRPLQQQVVTWESILPR